MLFMTSDTWGTTLKNHFRFDTATEDFVWIYCSSLAQSESVVQTRPESGNPLLEHRLYALVIQHT